MSADSSTHDGRNQSTEAMNELLNALAHPVRRSVVDELERGGTRTLDELAARVATDSRSVHDARVMLVHQHLPHLADAAVITYDADEETCELDEGTDVSAVLAAVRGQF